MDNAIYKRFSVRDGSDYPPVKRETTKALTESGFEDKRIADSEVVLSELTSNLIKHAKDGELLAGIFGTEGLEYLELITIDKGSGMAGTPPMTWHVSSSPAVSGSHGLGRIKQLSDFFQIYSVPEWGTIVVSRIFKARKPEPAAVDIKALMVAKPGEDVSGDGMAIKKDEKYLKVMIGDGLGHGQAAHDSMREASANFMQFPGASPVETLKYLHSRMHGSRGLVATIATFAFESKQWTIAGVGNIAGRFRGHGTGRTYIPCHGIIGYNIPETMDDTIIEAGLYGKIIFCSDGIRSGWNLDRHFTIDRYDPIMTSAALYKDFAKLTDDASVVSVKINV